MSELVFDAGISFASSSFDFTTRAVYQPTLFDRFNVGIGGVFHIKHGFKDFLETDALCGLYARGILGKYFRFSCNCLYLYRSAFIFTGEKTVCLNNKKRPQAAVELYFLPCTRLLISAGFSTYSFFDYYLAGNPHFKIAAAYDFSNGVSCGMEIGVRYLDFFGYSDAGNPAEIRMRTFMQIKIPRRGKAGR